MPASNVAVGSVINLDFSILYVLNGNKELILSLLKLELIEERGMNHAEIERRHSHQLLRMK